MAIRQRLKSDLAHYASKCLKIRVKAGGVIPFKMNNTQKLVDAKLSEQIEKKGKVRALILKGRQTGVSTYIQARFYHKCTHSKGVLALIITHMESATQSLFKMTNRFHEFCPNLVKPTTGNANAKELYFSVLDSMYKTATAGSAEVGRGDTIQLFHGSEVAFWPNAETHMEGVGQAIANEDGTEVILESTANGIGGLFHKMWKAAERGDIDYEAIFIPWFVHEEYTTEPPKNWKIPEAFAELKNLYNLTPGQTYWAYSKNKELAVSQSSPIDEICWKFKQEYPSNADEAFQTSGENAFVTSDLVMKTRTNTVEAYGPLILGVDPARGGGDKTSMVDRQGRKMGVHACKLLDNNDLMVTAASVVKYYKKHKPKKICVDVTGLGAGLYDRLKELIPSDVLVAVNFSSKATQPKVYKNRRTEIYDELREWFDDEAGVDIPDNDALHSDICAPVWGKGCTHTNSKGQLCLEPKDHIKERLGHSPDLGDGAALTFAIDMDALRDQPEIDINLLNQPVKVSGGWGAA